MDSWATKADTGRDLCLVDSSDSRVFADLKYNICMLLT